jgi:hypothetical protein
LTPPPTVLHWPGGGSWDPSQLSSLAAWYDADAITGLSNNDPVSTWADASGNGYDLTQTSTARPTYKTSTLNGLPVVEFDGSNDFLEASTAADWKFLHDSTGSSVFAVWKAGTTANPGVFYALCDTGGRSTAIGYRLAYLDSSGFDDQFNTQIARGVSGTLVVGNYTASGTHAANAAYLVTSISDPSNGTAAARSSIRLNGGSSVANNSALNTPSTSNPTAALHLGCEQIAASFLLGYIAEVVICDTVLTSTNREKIEGYLAHKWGLTAYLPSSHPYKSSAP